MVSSHCKGWAISFLVIIVQKSSSGDKMLNITTFLNSYDVRKRQLYLGVTDFTIRKREEKH